MFEETARSRDYAQTTRPASAIVRRLVGVMDEAFGDNAIPASAKRLSCTRSPRPSRPQRTHSPPSCQHHPPAELASRRTARHACNASPSSAVVTCIYYHVVANAGTLWTR
jgi:hypothetical protein